MEAPGPAIARRTATDLRRLPAVVYEREVGAASRPLSRPLSRTYRRREPENTVLHGVVREHLETFLYDARLRSASGAGYPAFVEHELRRYLDCGLLSRGFARLRCPSCGFERLVAFSCKGRLCPSCWGRRAADTAAHLVDRVLPEAHYRQVVLTFPFALRFLLATDRAFFAAMLRAYKQVLLAWQRQRGRKVGIRDGQTGAVSFVQRFGGALNLNPHLHTVTPAGLFVPSGDDTLRFVALPPPTDADIVHLTARVVRRLTPIAQRRLAEAEDEFAWLDDETAQVHAVLAEALRSPTGPVAPAAVSSTPDTAQQWLAKPLCARIGGFSLHAARTVEAHDRASLEQLCGYGLRAPFATERFRLDDQGQIHYELTRPWPTPDGKTELVFEPLQLLRRLAALVPPPYFNLVRYYGVFANRSQYRKMLPQPPPPPLDASNADAANADAADGNDDAADGNDDAADGNDDDQPQVDLPQPPDAGSAPIRPRRLDWARLLKRTLDVDALRCVRCATPMVVLAYLTDPAVVGRILSHLRLPASTSVPAPARSSPHEQFDLFDTPVPDDLELCDEPFIDDIDEPPSSSRGPPLTHSV
jgi:hypothetical protein